LAANRRVSLEDQANAERLTLNVERRSQSLPVALTIAGSDSSAGAGLQADLKTFQTLGVYGVTAVTCVVAEIPGKVVSLHKSETTILRQQIDVLLSSFSIGAAKTGLLCSAAVVSEVASALRKFQERSGRRLPLVVDPVMIATSGDRLLDADAISRYTSELFPLAALVTPNLDEAATLLGGEISDLAAMRTAGERLVALYRVPFLMKGGHLAGTQATDLLFTGSDAIEITAPFSRQVRTHGTGCTYSAATTAGLAAGMSLESAVRRAKAYVTRTIAEHLTWKTADGGEIHALNHSA
jgi:hydroxymethylpyrimidine/phosphomethylpyrimidine kinase